MKYFSVRLSLSDAQQKLGAVKIHLYGIKITGVQVENEIKNDLKPKITGETFRTR